ncbi:MAG: hypothetical protein U1F11_04680 [Steroidobacteraceae bacterium]
MKQRIGAWILAGGLGLAALGAAAHAATAQSNIRLAADTPVVPMAEWQVQQVGAAEQTGARILFAAGAEVVARAPAGAARYDSRTFRFDNGEIRVLTFRQASGGVLHQVTTETQLYVIKGSATVGVGGATVPVHAGDAVNLPSGVIRSIAGQVEDTTLLLHTLRTAPGSKAVVLRAADTPAAPLTAGPKAGTENVKVAVQRFAFGDNSIRVAHLVGLGTGTVTPPVDALIYLGFQRPHADHHRRGAAHRAGRRRTVRSGGPRDALGRARGILVRRHQRSEGGTMKIKFFDVDANGRLAFGNTVDIPFREVTPLHAETEAQDGAYRGISLNQPGEPIGGGPDEMHLTNQPRIVWVMSGHLDSRLQSGEVRRTATGEATCLRGLALHHSSFANSREPVITLSLTFPGTDRYEFRKPRSP